MGPILVQDRCMSTESSERQYWYNTKTGEVEEGHRSRWTNLMGPYATREEAQHALEQAQRRNETWDEQDERWKRD
jgi:hypothetical protein